MDLSEYVVKSERGWNKKILVQYVRYPSISVYRLRLAKGEDDNERNEPQNI